MKLAAVVIIGRDSELTTTPPSPTPTRITLTFFRMNPQPIQRVNNPQFLPQHPRQLSLPGIPLGLELQLVNDMAEIVVVVVLEVRNEFLHVCLGGLERTTWREVEVADNL